MDETRWLVIKAQFQACMTLTFDLPKSNLQMAHLLINSLPNDQILDMTKLKAFADAKLNVELMTILF